MPIALKQRLDRLEKSSESSQDNEPQEIWLGAPDGSIPAVLYWKSTQKKETNPCPKG